MELSTQQTRTESQGEFPSLNDRRCEVHSLGRIAYSDARSLQRQWAAMRHSREIPDRLLLLEHPAVITLGRNARREHLLSSPETLAAEGIELHESNRGGDVTYHGPGQLVGYPILDLARIRRDVVWYVRTLEEALIRSIAELGLEPARRAGMTGVWIGEAKVAAIGIHISRWITTHGFALNISTDLAAYRHIVPCGIATHPVSSLQEVLGVAIDRSDLERSVANHLGDLLGLRMQWVSAHRNYRREPCLPPMC